MKKLLFVLISLGLLLVMLMFIWSNTAQDSRAKQQQETKVEEPQAVVPQILVARYPIQAGALLRAQDLKWAAITGQEQQLNTLFIKGFVDPEALEGSLITASLTSGQPLTDSDLVLPEQSHYLSSMLAPDMKGVTIDITFAGGSYGLIKPGNYVDILLTTAQEHQQNEGFGDVLKHANSLVLENVRLLAVDNVLTDIVSGPTDGQPSEHFGQSGDRTLPVTFEVDIEGAQRLLLANKLGDLSLLLRSTRSSSVQEQSPSTTLWDEHISDNHHPSLLPDNAIRIFDGQDVRTVEQPITR
ncbi:Flp pilus assembly protein CpaB [Vibrio variabilis]|nr:Flp pilus assembly protein CpaB [Vibrio variabilis]